MALPDVLRVRSARLGTAVTLSWGDLDTAPSAQLSVDRPWARSGQGQGNGDGGDEH